MAILGLLILAAVAVVGVETAASNRSGEVVVETFGRFSTVSVSVVFVVGALLATIAILGLFMITGQFQRRWTQRRVARHRVTEEETASRLTETDRTNAELVEENDRLRAELAAERRSAATMGGVAVPPGVGNVAYGDQVSDAVRSETISDTGRYEPYPTEPADGRVPDERVTDERVTYGRTADGRVADERHDDKAGIVGRFRHNT